MKGIVIYTSKYGSTKQYAAFIGDSLGISIIDAREITQQSLQEYDYVVLGSPVYIGKPLMKQWVRKNYQILKDKTIFFYLVSGTPPSDVKPLEEILQRNLPLDLLKKMHVFYFHGKLIISQLGFIDRLLMKAGSRLNKNKSEAERMMKDFNDVHPSQVLPLTDGVKEYLKTIPHSSRSKFSEAKQYTHNN